MQAFKVARRETSVFASISTSTSTLGVKHTTTTPCMKGKGVEEKRKAVAARCGKALRKGYTVVAEKEVGDSWNKTALPAALLTLFPDLYETKTQAKKACRRKQVLVNKVASKCDVDVVAKDVVTITSRIAAVTHPDNPAFTKAALEVVYEDEHLAVVVKPQGTDTLGKGMSAMALLPFTLKPTSASFEESKGTLNKPRPCHRLDKATGGLLVCAKTSAAMGKICSAFSEREVHKTYVALVHGKPREEGIFEEPVDGKEAITEYYHMSTWEIGGKGEVMSTGKPSCSSSFPLRNETKQKLTCPIFS